MKSQPRPQPQTRARAANLHLEMRHAALVLCLFLPACSRQAPTLEPATIKALTALSEQVDGDRAMAHVQALVDAHLLDTPLDCSQWDATYEPDCYLTHDKARAYMQQQLEALGLTVTTQLTQDGVFTTANLIADLPGATHPEEVVWVGAHFDAFYAAADDNSSGAAGVLELARVLSAYTFDRTVRFIGFDLEEFGLVGSTRYVLSDPGEELVAGLVFDCIAYYDATPGSQTGLPGFPMPDTGDFLGVIGNDDSADLLLDVYAINAALAQTPVGMVVAPSDGAYALTGNLMRSDHTPFWLERMPTVFMTDTANFRNPHYHTDGDTIDTLSPDFYSDVLALGAASLAYWAGGVQ